MLTTVFRSTAPNSLSIWTKHIRGIKFHSAFKPQGCEPCPSFSAATLAAGEDWGEIYAAANQQHLTWVGGTGDTIGLGGYLTGGGHSPLSAKLGLGVDQVLQMEIVLASGETVISNEVKNADLFWAMRGVRFSAFRPLSFKSSLTYSTQGGGATFGIMTSVTLKTYPDMPVASVSVLIAAEPDSNAFWNFTTYIVSQAPRLQDAGIMGYTYLTPAYPYERSIVGGFLGVLLMPNGTVAELERSAAFLHEYISSIPEVNITFVSVQYPSLYAWYQVNKNEMPIGGNNAVGNRLLDGQALSNVTVLQAAMKKATPIGTLANLNIVAGPGMWAAKPAGGSDSVTPAWRMAYVEYGTTSLSPTIQLWRIADSRQCIAIPVSWPPFDNIAKGIQTRLLTDVYVEALRELAPHTGSYLNEVSQQEPSCRMLASLTRHKGDVNEPNFQQAYWGSNYPRLQSIKHKVDPRDLFWCVVCVGNEGWQEQGDLLCHV